LRQLSPNAIVTGNGGVPWTSSCPYFTQANGDMHENALGNEFGDPDWSFLWSGYRACMDSSNPYHIPRYHFIAVDLRQNRTLEEAEKVTTLSADDYRRLRFGLGTALLDNGYFGFDRGDCLHGQYWWFNEYNHDLGKPVGTYSEYAEQPGVYTRTFTKGMVVVNTTSAAITVELPSAYVNATTRVRDRIFTIAAEDAAIFATQ